MASFQVGFFAIIILAAYKVVMISLEALFNLIERPKAQLIRLSGYFSAFLALVLGCISFVGLQARRAHRLGTCEDADADIVGDGVRAAAWIQVGSLFFITLTGIFHFYKTAVKEIGGGLIITHVSLAIALLVPLARKELSPMDAILGSLILDAQGNSLSIQLVTKETLAARWQVAIAVIAQVLGLVIEGVLVGNFTTTLPPKESCTCFFVFWWTWFSNCPSASPHEVKPFWIYFGYRFINIIHGSYFAITRTSTFDDAEKWDRENPCDPLSSTWGNTICWLQMPSLRKMSILQSVQESGSVPSTSTYHPDTERLECDLSACCAVLLNGERFSESTVTVSANFLESSVLALLSMISVEVTMNRNVLEKTDPIYAVGQVTALLIAVATAIRALWVFLYMFDSKTHSAY
ncbi:hypothetical protein F5Y13DRAFT_187640 [Hypoxylon sp. FL1857]|nr:hypothetical protein F5Y13DRAFT_187640 [Hypoxylon sp. FL1857]